MCVHTASQLVLLRSASCSGDSRHWRNAFCLGGKGGDYDHSDRKGAGQRIPQSLVARADEVIE